MVSEVQQTNTNPLAKHFRQPTVYIDLPSQGKYYPNGSLNAAKQLSVYPMTALDEINMRTPDALYNGTSMVNLIKSCIPDIKDPWAVPMTDFDTILIAVKMASQGNEIDITTTCPSCTEESDFSADLGRMLSSITVPNYDKSVVIKDLEIYFRPLNYKQVSENSLWQVDQQRTINEITASATLTDSEKASRLNDIWLNITRATIDVVAMSVEAVKTADAVVRDQAQIREFLHNCSQDIYSAIRDQAMKLRDESQLAPLNVTCPSCQHKYEQPFALDQSNFFA